MGQAMKDAGGGFSALQRAEIAEIETLNVHHTPRPRFSALQRAEIAEMRGDWDAAWTAIKFQCSSTSRNC